MALLSFQRRSQILRSEFVEDSNRESALSALLMKPMMFLFAITAPRLIFCISFVASMERPRAGFLFYFIFIFFRSILFTSIVSYRLEICPQKSALGFIIKSLSFSSPLPLFVFFSLSKYKFCSIFFFFIVFPI